MTCIFSQVDKFMLRDHMRAMKKTFIEKIYNDNIISVNTNTKDEEVANIMNKYEMTFY